jgi:hypothetical protein
LSTSSAASTPKDDQRELDVAEHDPDAIIIPHLTYGEAELNERYPPMTVPEDPYDDEGRAQAEDESDGILQAGLARARELMADAEAYGRRRYMPDDAPNNQAVTPQTAIKVDSRPNTTTNNHSNNTTSGGTTGTSVQGGDQRGDVDKKVHYTRGYRRTTSTATNDIYTRVQA